MKTSKHTSDNTDSGHNPLGEKVQYPSHYNPQLLYRIPRSPRYDLNFKDGFDRWVAYEFTWLANSGCPQSCVLEITIPAASNFIVESKSLKLYLGGFSQERHSTKDEVLEIIQNDLQKLLESNEILVRSLDLEISPLLQIKNISAQSLDNPEVACSNFSVPLRELLETTEMLHNSTVYSNLFRSLCPVTGQPDYATIFVNYQGNKIKEDSLLKYLVSYRNHAGFHETCCEKIFEDILKTCKPQKLSVACFFTRRGGIDINPVRSTEGLTADDFVWRCSRQ